MAGKFVLTAQMQLQAPTNTGQVISQLRSQMNKANISINPQVNTKSISSANKQMTNLGTSAITASNSLGKASKSAQSLGASLGAAARRFASITIATGFFLGLTRAIGDSVRSAVEFEKEMIKISQVTGKSVAQLGGLQSTITKLSTTLGVSSQELATVSRTLLQAGFSADVARKSLNILAKTDLAATFDNLQDTTEGAVALLRQFSKEAAAAGGPVKFLEQSIDAINSVSKNFAVESKDLISAIRRTGGVFEASGGKLNELIALFTSVRSTTRETAETIATGFRTIFTRIQRTETVDQLRELGVVLQDSTGKFVGPLEAIKRLSVGLSSLDPRDFRFNQIVEQLGGFRQVGKVIPLIKQYTTSTEALAIANNAAGSTAEDAKKAQQGLGNQVAQLGEKFAALFRSIVDSETFRSFAEGAIKLAEAFIRIVDSLKPLLPMLAQFAAFRLGKIAIPAIGKFAGVGGKNQGGRIHAFNSGGLVPGSGNRDTVPAMLSPGEFVIRKSSVNSIGSGNLAKMNGYAGGGKVKEFGAAILSRAGALDGYSAMIGPKDKFTYQPLVKRIQQGDKNSKAKPGSTEKKLMGMIMGDYQVKRSGPSKELKQSFDKHLDTGIIAGMEKSAQLVGSDMGLGYKKMGKSGQQNFLNSINDGAVGNLFEQVLDALAGEPFDNRATDPRRPFDFVGGLGKLADDFPAVSKLKYVDAKASFEKSARAQMKPKIVNQLGLLSVADAVAKVKTETKKKPVGKKGPTAAAGGVNFNSGGRVDTVPAMLTPGEYVINKSAAQSIGYGNLNTMNKGGVAKFAAGGGVGPMTSALGSGGGGARIMTGGGQGRTKAIMKFQQENMKASNALARMNLSLTEANTAIIAYSRAIVQGASHSQALGRAEAALAAPMLNLNTSTSMNANSQKKVAGLVAESIAHEKRLNQARIEQTKKLRSQGFKAGMAGGGGKGVAMAGKAVGSVGQGAMFAAMFAPMAIELMGFKGALADTAAQFLMMSSMVLMVVAPLIEMAATAYANIASKVGEIAITKTLIATKMGEIAAMTLIIAPILVLVGILGYFAFDMMLAGNKAKEAAKELDGFTKSLMDEGGSGNVMQDFSNMSRRLGKSAEASFNAEVNNLGSHALNAMMGDFDNSAATDAFMGMLGPAERAGDGFAMVIAKGANGVSKFNETMGDIQTMNLEGAEKANAVADATLALVGDVGGNAALFAKAQKDLEEAQKRRGEAGFSEEALKGFEDAAKNAKAQVEKDFQVISQARAQSVASMNEEAKRRMNAGEDLGSIESSAEHQKLQKAAIAAIREEVVARAESKGEELTKGQITGRVNKIMSANAQHLEDVNAQIRENKIREMEAADAAQAMAEAAIRAARAMNAMEVIGIKTQATLSAFDSQLAAATGGFQAVDHKLGEFIGTLSGGITSAGAGALMSTAGSIGAAGQGSALLSQISTAEKMRSRLAQERGVGGKFRGTLDQASGRGVAEDFLKEFDLSGLDKKVQDKILTMLSDGLEEGEIEEIFEMMQAGVEDQVSAFQKVAEIQKQYADAYQKGVTALLAAKDKERAAVKKFIDIQFKGAERLRKARGEEGDGAAIARAKRGAAVGNLGFGTADSKRIGAMMTKFTAMAQNFAAQASQTTDPGKRSELNAAQQVMADKAKRAGEALKILADRSDEAAGVMKEIEKEKQGREAMQDELKKFTFSSNEQRAGIKQAYAALEKVLVTGELNSIPDNMRATVGQLLDKFKNVPVFGGMTGDTVSKQLQVKELDRQFGGRAPEELVKAIFMSTSKEDQLIEELKAINQAEATAQAELAKSMADNSNSVANSIKQLQNALKPTLEKLTNVINAFPRPKGAASGGLIYRADGGSIFKPKGTDTVPAMLTPGEFVIRKSAVDKIGVGALSALNNGNASPVYRAQGGVIGSEAVKKYIQAGIFTADTRDQLTDRNIFWQALPKEIKDDMLQIARQQDMALVDQYFPNTVAAMGLFSNVANTGRMANPGFRGLGKRMFEFKQGKGMPEIKFNGDLNKGGGAGLGVNSQEYFNTHLPNLESGTTLPNWLRNAGPTFYNGVGKNFKPVGDSMPAVFWKGLWENGKNAQKGDPKRGIMGWNPSFLGNENTMRWRKSWTWNQAKVLSGFGPNFIHHLGGLFHRSMTDNPEAYLLGIFNRQYLADAEVAKGALADVLAGQSKFVKRQRQQTMAAAVRDAGGIKAAQNFATGGGVDTVPAMLTPGEFVMNSSAVKKHGLGFMSALNKGEVPGFNKGGYVGYRQAGGPIYSQGISADAMNAASIDNQNKQLNDIEKMGKISVEGVTRIVSGLRKQFGQNKFYKGGYVGGGAVQYKQGGGMIGRKENIMDGIANALSAFNNIAVLLNNIAVMFSNLNIHHTIQVDGTLNIPGFSQQAINNIVGTIGQQVVMQTEEKINVALNEFNRKLNQRAD